LRVIVSRRSSERFWRLLSLTAVVVALIGMWGLHQKYPGEYAANIYRLLVLFTIDIDFAAVASSNWALYISRFLAPLTTIAALLWILVENASRWWVMARLARWPPDALVIGGDDFSRVLVRALIDKGTGEVVLLVPEPDEVTISFCEANKVLLLQAEIASLDNLSLAGAGRCRACYVVTDDDTKNLQIVEQLRGLQADSASVAAGQYTFVRINSTMLFRGLYRYQRFTDNAIPFSLETLLARDAILRFPIYEYAHLRGTARIHAVIIGFDSLGQALAQELALHCHYRDLETTMVSVVALDGRERLDVFDRDFPKYRKACEYNPFAVNGGDWQATLAELAELEEQHPITAIYIAGRDESENLSIALAVREAADVRQVLLAPVFVYAPQGEDFHQLLHVASETNEFHRVIQPFGVMGEAVEDSWLVDYSVEDLAKYFHAQFSASNKIEPWASLSETMRESNRRAAVHARVKLASSGYLTTGGLSEPISLSPKASIIENKSIWQELSVLEHRRWMADRYLDGWDYAPERSNAQRLHPLLVPFSQLPQKEQDKDYAQIRMLFDWATAQNTAVNTIRVISLALVGEKDSRIALKHPAKENAEETIRSLCSECADPFSLDLFVPVLPDQNLLGAVSVLEFAQRLGIRCRIIAVFPMPIEGLVHDLTPATCTPGYTEADAQRRYQDMVGTLVARSEWVVRLYPLGEADSVWASDKRRLSAHRELGEYLRKRTDEAIRIDDSGVTWNGSLT